MSEARVFASVIISVIRCSARERLWRPSSPAARPSAICFCRAAMACISAGQMNFAQAHMKTKKIPACMNRVRLMFMTVSPDPCRPSGLLQSCRDERVRVREEHGDPEADDEGGVDQAEEQEYLGLQRRNHFRLPGGPFEEPRAHDADAHAGAE